MSELVIKVIVVAALLGIVTAGYFGWRDHQRSIGAQAQREIDQMEVATLKRQAAEKLDAALRAKSEAERKLRETQDAQAVKDAKNLRSVADLAGRLAALAAGGAGRLRDPNQTGGCGSGSGSPPDTATAAAGDSAGDGTKTGGLLSKELSGLLQRLQREADEINVAYISCRENL